MSSANIILDNVKDVTSRICSVIIEKANVAIEKNGMFNIGLSGGSLPNMLSEGLPSQITDWSKWRVFFCDERLCAFDCADSTYGLYKKQFLPHVSLKEDNIYTINPSLSVEEAAKDYETRLRGAFPSDVIPRLDVLVLGMGPDGHTCSLFPQHKLLKETHLLIAPIDDSPKPPPKRITMTLPLINNCHYAMFVTCGENKAKILKRVLVDHESLPSGLVQPTHGTVEWFMDKPAARLL